MKPSGVKEAPGRRPLVTTKLRPPTNRGALVDRPQLLNRLREAMKRKLALIHGPAGFGKTTLAAQWYVELKSAGVLTAWITIDASDNDANRLLAYLVESFRTADPDMGSGLREVIEANPGSALDFVLDALINDLSVHDADFVLFIDDWHLVRESVTQDALQLLISRAPPNLHVVVASRTRAGVPLTRLRVQNEVIEIDATHLRFDYEESRT
jgi:ATP/maltotriose-dependent transcriptional regulator MalT